MAEAAAKNRSEMDTQTVPPTPRIYQLKIELENIHPHVWRRFYVSDDTMLLKLHRIIQTVMGWGNYHLHAFHYDECTYGPKDPYLSEHYDEKEYVLRDIAEDVGSYFMYQYDMGCDWMHSVVIEKIVEPAGDVPIPTCIEGKRACPPEDVNSVGGYYHFLEAIAHPEHPDHDELKKWIGYDFKPEEFDVDKVNKRLYNLDYSDLDESEFF